MDLLQKGVEYWNKVLTMGVSHRLISFQEQSAIKQIISMITSGNIPSTSTGNLPRRFQTTIKDAIEAESKVSSEGLL